MVDDDVLYRFRLRLFSLAGGARQRARGVPHLRRPPLDLLPLAGTGAPLGPRDAPAPASADHPGCPTRRASSSSSASSPSRLGHPGLGPRRISATLAQERWGGIVISPNGVWRVLRRHGLSRRISRLSLVAGYAAPPGPERPSPLERGTSRWTIPASSSASTASTSAGSGHHGEGLAVHRHRPRQLPCLGGAAHDAARPLGAADQPAGETGGSGPAPGTAGASSGCSPTTGASSARRSSERRSGTSVRPRRSSGRVVRPPTAPSSGSSGPSSRSAGGRPSRGAWCPSSTGLGRDLAGYLGFYNHERAHTGRLTAGRTPYEALVGARKMRPR